MGEIRKNAPKSRFTVITLRLVTVSSEWQYIEFQLGEQKYIATLNTTIDYTISGSNVAIGAKNYSFSEALELLVEDQHFIYQDLKRIV